MPRCINCKFFEESQCTAHAFARVQYDRPVPPPPIGACTFAIVDSYRELLRPGMRVLEIGCGTWPLLKSICIQVGAHYEGIDTQAEYYGKPTIATRIENLQELSFLDETFDLVIGNQTIEHWAEFGCDTAFGLYQCFRVCKIGGTVIMNAPVHFHGSRPFLMGDFVEIQNLFLAHSNAITIEPWGFESDPIPKFYTYKKYPALSGKHAYIIDIRAVKSHVMVGMPAVIWMPLKLRRWINYPLSFLLYRAKLKLGLIRE